MAKKAETLTIPVPTGTSSKLSEIESMQMLHDAVKDNQSYMSGVFTDNFLSKFVDAVKADMFFTPAETIDSLSKELSHEQNVAKELGRVINADGEKIRDLSNKLSDTANSLAVLQQNFESLQNRYEMAENNVTFFKEQTLKEHNRADDLESEISRQQIVIKHQTATLDAYRADNSAIRQQVLELKAKLYDMLIGDNTADVEEAID